MRRLRWFSPIRRTRPIAKGQPEASNRRGSTIVVVIALLLALTFLGIVGYTIGVQEHGNATYFSDAAKEFDFGVTRDALFDWSLRQIILGTYQHEERQSALHGGHMSLLATMFGDNATPYDGEGVHLAYDAGGNLIVDQDFNPSTSEASFIAELNRAPFSGGANAVILDQSINSGYPQPDVGYNYWDINSPYLAYVKEGHVWGANGEVTDANGNLVRVALPSYHRPQYLRHTGISADQWYTDPTTQRMVLRPHVEHRAIADNGTVTDTRRFVSAAHPQAGMTSFPGLDATTTNSATPANDNINDGVWDPNPLNSANPGVPLANSRSVKYDADPDKDGIFDAIWLDLGFPMQTRERADGTVVDFVPMFAVTIFDADALFNLNVHGNLAGLSSFANTFVPPVDPGPDGNFGTMDDIYPFGSTGPGADGDYSTVPDNILQFASRSNQAVGVSEVNPQWGLLASPADGSTTQHQRFFQHTPFDNMELSNMEWWFLVSGRGDLDATGNIDKIYQGRNGEITQLDNAMTNALGVHSYPKPGNTFPAYPSPGNYNPNLPANWTYDDNLDAQLGGTYTGNNQLFPSGISFPAWQHPLDIHGSGRFTAPINLSGSNAQFSGGRMRYTLQNGGRHIFASYLGYQHNPAIDLWAKTNTQFQMQGNSLRYNVDEPEEIIYEPDYVRSDLDSVFGADENAILHLAQADQDVLNLSGRLRDLAPVNFDGSNAALTEQRRRTFTTTSWDLKTFGTTDYDLGNLTTPDARRAWETDSAFASSTAYQSLRSEVQELFAREHDPITSTSKLAMARKLSPNHLCVWEGAANASNLLLRPLTPHPDGNGAFGQLGNEPVNSTNLSLSVTIASKPININDAVDQEWFARRDRQQLCRDIYQVMYLYCGGDDTKDYSTANPYTLDSDADGIPDALKAMAQFAVNLVDRMDPDFIATKFEFDINLSNGWNLDDDPFTDSTTTATPGYTGVETPNARTGVPNQERGVVYGVEQQQLALNEAQVVIARQVKDTAGIAPTNHNGTEWDDTVTRDWTYVEVENVTPEPIDFANESWQIVVKPGTETVDPSNPNQSLLVVAGDVADPTNTAFGEERRLTLTAPATNTFVLQSGAQSRLMLATAGDKSNIDPMSGSPRPSHVMVNPNDRDPAGDPLTFTRVTPLADLTPPGPASSKDLLNTPTNLYRVNKGSSTNGDGIMVTPDPSTDLLAIQYPVDTTSGQPRYDIIDDTMDRRPRGTGIPVKFELRRRLNPLRTPPIAQNATGSAPGHDAQSTDNPWIVVDTLTIDMDVFQLNDTNDKYDAIQKQLTGADPSTMTPQDSNSFTSKERTEPLRRNGEHNHFVNTGGALNYQRNTLGSVNRDTTGSVPSAYSQYQPHFNRDYGSAMELMAVPLYGPGDTTRDLEQSDTPYVPPSASYIVAANKIKNPLPINASFAETGNRWYRLFEFLGVPDRTHRHPETDASGNPIRPAYVINLGNRTTNPDLFYRSPGKLQLNTMRHPEVLGGLLDDPEVAQLNLASITSHLPDQGTGTGSGSARDWWVQFVQARDGVDSMTGMILPGTAGAKPFRPFSYSADKEASLQSTVLRDLPFDGAGQRTLFELGDQGQALDHSVKYRMLEKVINNSTTRSNVFLIFIQVDFFEAAKVKDPNTGLEVVRVGGKLSDSPEYRGFFVVDRSKAQYLLGTGDFPQAFTDSVDTQTKFNYSFNQGFDFHQLILHRQTIN